MIDVAVGPCAEGWSPVEIIAALASGFNLIMVGFLVNRRLAKDRKDDLRWSGCPLVSSSGRPVVHTHGPKNRDRFNP